MGDGGDQDVTVVVGILVHEDHGVLVPVKQEVVLGGLSRGQIADKAALLTFREDVLHAPGGPKHFHNLAPLIVKLSVESEVQCVEDKRDGTLHFTHCTLH